MSTQFTTLERAISQVADGSRVAFSKLYPMALVRELIRQGKRDLRFVGMPIAGLAADLLAASGSLASVETGAVTLGPLGAARSYQRAVREGAVKALPSSCSVIVSALTGGSLGQPFVAVPGLIGSGILRERDDFLVIPNPYEPEFDIVLVPSIQPDVAFIHAAAADAEGNLLVDGGGDEALLARAARRTIATVESVSPEALDRRARGSEIISGAYVDFVVAEPRSTHPFPGYGDKTPDRAALQAYVAASATPAEIAAYIDRVIRSSGGEADYLAKAAL
ncbi:CoA-transferase [Bosea massiliensis]|uniref:CoA-transferase n=1 Tax=Bosea massiliensis TaxID=151419 RepID=A0ABW0P9T5_9HYPH